MSLRINTNVSALTAYQNLNKNQNALSSAIEKRRVCRSARV
jgi:flagellin-like hook-associated protein FlgL